jgi:hypothetical protein
MVGRREKEYKDGVRRYKEWLKETDRVEKMFEEGQYAKKSKKNKNKKAGKKK